MTVTNDRNRKFTTGNDRNRKWYGTLEEAEPEVGVETLSDAEPELIGTVNDSNQK